MKTKTAPSNRHRVTRRSGQERQKLLEEFNNSGLNQAEFSRKSGVNAKTLQRWIRESKPVKDVFHPPVELTFPVSPLINIRLPNGITVSLPMPSDCEGSMDLIKELMKC